MKAENKRGVSEGLGELEFGCGGSPALTAFAPSPPSQAHGRSFLSFDNNYSALPQYVLFSSFVLL